MSRRRTAARRAPAGRWTDSDTIAITINSVNDAPSGADKTLTGERGRSLRLRGGRFRVQRSGRGQCLSGGDHRYLPCERDVVPGRGRSWRRGTGQSGDDRRGRVRQRGGHQCRPPRTSQPDADEFGNGYASFTFRVQDDGGIANGGVDRDPVANTITIDVTPDNLPPVVDLDGGTAGHQLQHHLR